MMLRATCSHCGTSRLWRGGTTQEVATELAAKVATNLQPGDQNAYACTVSLTGWCAPRVESAGQRLTRLNATPQMRKAKRF